MPRDRWGFRRTFRTPPGRSAVSWRWEVGLPLFVIGSITVIFAAGAELSGWLFWPAVVATAIGATLFLVNR